MFKQCLSQFDIMLSFHRRNCVLWHKNNKVFVIVRIMSVHSNTRTFVQLGILLGQSGDSGDEIGGPTAMEGILLQNPNPLWPCPRQCGDGWNFFYL